MADDNQESTIDAIRELNDLVAKARAGDESVLPQLRQAMDQNPEIWRHFGSLAEHVANEWGKLLSGSDLAVRESLARNARAMREELEGVSPSAIERLLIDAVITTWLESEYFSIVLAGADDQGSPRQIESLQIRRDGALKRHLSSIKSLAEVRKLLRPSPLRGAASRVGAKGGKRSRATTATAARNARGPRTIPIKHRRNGRKS